VELPDEPVEEPPDPELVEEPPDPETVVEPPDPVEDPPEVEGTWDEPPPIWLVEWRVPPPAFPPKSWRALTFSFKSPSACRSSSNVVPRAVEAPAFPGTLVTWAGESLTVNR
jgi:hypothetical protein